MNKEKKRAVKLVALSLLLAFVLTALTGCLEGSVSDLLDEISKIDISDNSGNSGNSDDSGNSGNSGSSGFVKPDGKVPTQSTSFGDHYLYYYDQLSDSEKIFYDGFAKAFENGSREATFNGVNVETSQKDSNEFERAMEAFTFDRRDLFYVGYGGDVDWNNLYYSQEGNTLWIYFEKQSYWQNMLSFDSYQKKFDDKVDQVVNEINRNCSNDYEKALYAHDYLVKNASYDHDALNDMDNYYPNYNPADDLIFTSYGALVNGKCVCAGYASAYKVLLDRLGIPCVYVVGLGDPADPNSGHAWNRVVIGGKSYYVDITWDDDGDLERMYPDAVMHNFFNITTYELEKTHVIEKSMFYQPDCVSDDYNYFNYNGYEVDGYDFDKFVAIAENQKSESCICVRFSDNSGAERAKVDLKNGGWRRIGWLSEKYDIGAFALDEFCFVLYK